MKILSLNACDGELEGALKNYLESQLPSVDIFCFQETLGNTIETLFAELFPATLYSSISTEKTTGGNGQYNLCTIVKGPLQITQSQTLLDVSDTETGQALATTISLPGNNIITVVNVHGAPFPGHKLDTDGRLRQSDTIISWLQKNNSPSIVCGDFNLLPEAESVKKFAAAGHQDLIETHKIPTTRNRLAWELYPDNIQLFADYTFVSPEVSVIDFHVPNNEVSDHLPMLITIET